MLEPPISEDILMYLINAIYFKGEWTEQFDPELTYQDNFISNMTLENWKGIKKSVIDRDDIVFRIPRFKLEYGTKSLKDSLISLGMEEAFSDDADFSGIREYVAISEVMHKAVIEVNEEGSEAAAATVVELKETGAAEPITFIADRPFMFIINNDVTDTILFMGKVLSIDK